jgi:hypothetical protein
VELVTSIKPKWHGWPRSSPTDFSENGVARSGEVLGIAHQRRNALDGTCCVSYSFGLPRRLRLLLLGPSRRCSVRLPRGRTLHFLSAGIGTRKYSRHDYSSRSSYSCMSIRLLCPSSVPSSSGIQLYADKGPTRRLDDVVFNTICCCCSCADVWSPLVIVLECRGALPAN